MNSPIPFFLVALLLFGIIALPTSRHKLFMNAEPANTRPYHDEVKVCTLWTENHPWGKHARANPPRSHTKLAMTGGFRPLHDARCMDGLQDVCVGDG